MGGPIAKPPMLDGSLSSCYAKERESLALSTLKLIYIAPMATARVWTSLPFNLVASRVFSCDLRSRVEALDGLDGTEVRGLFSYYVHTYRAEFRLGCFICRLLVRKSVSGEVQLLRSLKVCTILMLAAEKSVTVGLTKSTITFCYRFWHREYENGKKWHYLLCGDWREKIPLGITAFRGLVPPWLPR